MRLFWKRKNSTRRSGRVNRASAVMEAALIFPVLLSLTFGSIEFGHFFYVKHTLQGAAREGARAAITPSATNADVTNAVNAAMGAAGFTSGQYTVQVRNATDTANVTVNTVTSGNGILIKVSANWGTVGIRPLGVIGSGKTVLGQTVMRKEG
jgi:Flp pilus assembly protein TadG